MADTSPTYEQIQEAADFIKGATNTTARVAVITGAALGVMPKCCKNGEGLDCATIPHIGKCGDEDCTECPNVFYSGLVENSPVFAMAGRPYVAGDVSLQKTSLFIKCFKLMGVETIILIAPAGALNPSYKVGDVMILKDHVNFMGMAGYNPLFGKNDERFGPKFVSLNKAYSEELRAMMSDALKEVNYGGEIYEGIYVAITGPVYPTPAEKNFLKSTNADAVGMYLIPEILLAKYCGLDVIAICVITEEFKGDEVVNESNYEDASVIGDQNLEALNSCVEKMVTQLDSRPRAVGDTGTIGTNVGTDVDVGAGADHRDTEIDVQSTLTAGPCCRCGRRKKK